MRELNHQRELVSVFSKISLRCEQKKPRVVFAAVFQMLAQNHSAIPLGRAFSGDGRARRITPADDPLDAARGIFRRDSLDLRISSQEAAALIERDRMRFHGANLLEGRARATDQAVTDRNDHFANNVEMAIQE